MSCAVDEPVWLGIPICDDFPVGKVESTWHCRDGVPPDPTLQEAACLLVGGSESTSANVDMAHVSFGGLDGLVDRLKSAIEQQIEKTLTRHHDELLSTFEGRFPHRGSRKVSVQSRGCSRKLSAQSQGCSRKLSAQSHGRGTPTQAQQKKKQQIMVPDDNPANQKLSQSTACTTSPVSNSVGLRHFKQNLKRQATAAEKTLLLTQQTKDEWMLALAMGEDRSSAMTTFSTRVNYEEDDDEYMSSPTVPARSNKKNRKMHLRLWLQSPLFEFAMGVLVCTNSLYVGVEIEYNVNHPGGSPLAFIIISYFYTLVFIVELCLRLVADWKGFLCAVYMKELLWNYLDIILVMMSLAEVATDIVFHDSANNGAGMTNNMRIIRMIRVFRVVRVFRIVRIVRFLTPLRQLVYSILVTLKSVFWSMILMATIIYVFAIVFTQATFAYREAHGGVAAEHLERYWNKIGTSMLTLLAAIAGGISWLEAVEPLKNMGVLWMYIFLLYIGFTYFAVLNVVTGVFCQAAMVSTSEDQDSMMQTVLRHKQMYTDRFIKIFEILDENQSGTISIDEFVARMGDADVVNYFASLDLSCEDALCLFDLIDDVTVDGIAVEEFVMGCLRLKGHARSSDMIRLIHDSKRLMEQLYRIHDDVKGAISTGKLKERALVCKEHASPD